MTSTSLNHRRVEVVPEELKYLPKPPKQWSFSRSLEYLLREQRITFILLGVGITTLFFMFVQPEFRRTNAIQQASSSLSYGDIYGIERSFEAPYKQSHLPIISPGGKIPLGLQRKSLRIVVTGGAGFVGSHLVDRLIERGDSVIVVDNFFTGRRENVQHHFGNPRFELIRHDVVEPLMLEVDQIYHLACPASPVHYKFNPIKTIISFLQDCSFFK